MDRSMPSPDARPAVLVVDDDEDIRATLHALLESEGYRVVDAATVTDALAYLRTPVAPHVVLLDFLFPRDNADLLLQAVKQEACLQRHRYVLMPANLPTRFSVDAQRLITTLCTEVVLKPFELTTMLGAVARAAAQL
jgi:DNA-binding NtrC family response regulator